MSTRILALALASTVIAAGVALVVADRDQRPSSRLSSAEVPDVARIACDRHGTRVLTPVVRPQPDGVYLTVVNRADARHIELHPTGSEQGTAVGERLPSEATRRPHAWSIEPGEFVVACLPTGQDAYWEVPNARMSVVDPEGLWIPTEVECSTSVVRGHSGIEGDLYELSSEEARAAFAPFVAGLRDEDRIVSPGYADTAWRVPLYVVVREDEVVAELYALQGLYLTTCAGSGIDVVRP